jgi:hypothetical protein
MLRSSLALAFLAAKSIGMSCLLWLQTLIQRFIRANEERSSRWITTECSWIERAVGCRVPGLQSRSWTSRTRMCLPRSQSASQRTPYFSR